MRLEGHIARMGEMINAMKYFGGKTWREETTWKP
jgi:hypothetical protein